MSQGLTQLKGLVTKVADVLHSRAESNLKAVQATRLVDLPHDRTFTQEDFASHQAAFAKRHAERLAIRSASGSFPCPPVIENGNALNDVSYELWSGECFEIGVCSFRHAVS